MRLAIVNTYLGDVLYLIGMASVKSDSTVTLVLVDYSEFEPSNSTAEPGLADAKRVPYARRFTF